MSAAVLSAFFLAVSPSFAKDEPLPDMKKESSPFMQMRPGARSGPRCPSGTHPVESPMGFRCVMGPPPKGIEEAKPSLPGRAHLDKAPIQRIAPAPPPEAPLPDPLLEDRVLGPENAKASQDDAPLVPREFLPFTVKGLTVAIPRGWHVTDAWKDEVPSLYIEPPTRRRGKPITLLVSRLAPRQPGYESLERALAKEKEYQNAEERAARKVSGLRCRQLVVAGESRTVYADAGDGVYFLLSYTAPQELFARFEPVFEQLLSSAKLGK